MRTRATLALSTLALALAGTTTAAPATAQPDTSRLPYAGEVQQVYTELAGGDRQVRTGARHISTPDPDADGTGPESACVATSSAARAPRGSNARYGPQGPEGSEADPKVGVRRFATREAARTAFREASRRIRQCVGTYRAARGPVVLRVLDVPRFGQGRIGYRTDDPEYGVHVIDVLTVRDTDVVLTRVQLDGPGRPSQDRAERLTWLALRTL